MSSRTGRNGVGPRPVRHRGDACRARAWRGGSAVLFGVASLVACADDGPLVPASIEELVRATEPSDVKILVIGIDGASFSVLEPLIAAGRLPTMSRLMNEGSHGPLRSVTPIRSSSIWTSIATGRDAGVHGIESFVRDDDEGRLITSNARRVQALWNWASAFKKQVGFNGWWVTWPAEPVEGWIVSDRLTRSRWSEWLDGNRVDHVTYPAELAGELMPLLIDPTHPPMDEIDRMVSFNEDERVKFLAAERPLPAEALSVFKFAYCSQRSYERIALHMLAKEQPDLTGVFLIANDSICHTYWHYYEPDAFEGVDRSDAERLGALIPAIQEHNDRFVADLLASVDSETIVLIVSDHGFQASGILRSEVQTKDYRALRAEAEKTGVMALDQPGKHHIDGVLIAHGPFIRKGVDVKAHVYDIAPTILALMGLPVPENLEGRVLTEIIEPEFLARYPVTRIDSYDRLLERERIELPEDAHDEEIMDHLKALGYVDAGTDSDSDSRPDSRQ